MNTTTEPQPDIEWLASHGPSDWPAISFEDAVRALGVEHAIAVWHLTEGSAQRARDELDAFRIAHNGAMTGTQALITQLRSDLQQTQQELQNVVATMATLQQQLGPAVGPGAAPVRNILSDLYYFFRIFTYFIERTVRVRVRRIGLRLTSNATEQSGYSDAALIRRLICFRE